MIQFQKEGLAKYWKRFNRFCIACPNHQISEPLLLVHFYEGLHHKDRMFIDATVGGSLLDKTPTEAKKLLCKMDGDDPVEVANEELV